MFLPLPFKAQRPIEVKEDSLEFLGPLPDVNHTCLKSLSAKKILRETSPNLQVTSYIKEREIKKKWYA